MGVTGPRARCRRGAVEWSPMRLRRLLEEALERPPREAVAAAREGRVYLLDEKLDVWLVEGRRGDYVVVRGLYCSCPWFQARVLTGEAERPCYHLVAVELVARGLEGRARRLDGRARDVLLEALLDGFSRTLRRLKLGPREDDRSGV